MRNLRSTLHYLGVVLIAFSALQAVPLLISAIYSETVRFPMRIYAIPAGISLAVGAGLVSAFRSRPMTPGTAMAVGALGWFGLSLIGAVPYWLALDVSFLDALFESVSGFTTTGATVLTGLEILPKSLLLWRSLSQWIGGLGIFTLFLFVVREGGMRHVLLGAESHKMATERFSPGVFSSLRILWSIYGGLTLLCALLLWAEGLGPFDAAVHGMTSVATGGFSTYDANIGHFAASGYRHAVAIEYTIVAFMFLGGTSFLVHWNLLRGRLRSVWRNRELRLWIALLAVASGIVIAADWGAVAERGLHAHIRTSLFHVVSIATTSGFTTREIGSPEFSSVTKELFLLLMIVGGCVASTSGGLKIRRVNVLRAILRKRLHSITRTGREVVPLTVGGRLYGGTEIERAVAIAVAWALSLAVGWVVLAAASEFGPWLSLSGVVSAISNIGPSYIPASSLASAGPAVKVSYILGMVAGRLEILPLLLIFSRRVWR